jgi:hypothetical protein
VASHPHRQLSEPSAPDLLYERTVKTRLLLPEPNRLVAEASLLDDTYGPGGFQTIHHMTLRMEVSLPDVLVTAADANMASHPHEACPGATAHVQQLVGLRITVSSRLGGKRSCNHLLSLAQTIGTVVALSYAARMSLLDPELASLPDDDYFRLVVAEHDNVVDSCYVWRGGGPLITELDAPRRGAR